MTSASVCGKCQSLLIRPEESIPERLAKTEDYEVVSYDQSTITASAKDGCRMCQLLLDRYHGDFPLVAYLGKYDASGSGGEGLMIWVRGSCGVIELEPRCTPSDVNGAKNNCITDIYGRPSLPVAILSTEVSGDTRHNACLGVIKDWINICASEHKVCQESSRPEVETSQRWLPTRLVSTGMHGLPRLIPRSEIEANHEDIRYTTLSHRWDDLRFDLLRTNVDAMRRQIIPDALPPVFRDALDVTRRLEIPYVWIDALCIIQDSKEDWATESALMGQIYENAFCNLAATAAADKVDSQAGTRRNHPRTDAAGLYVTRDPTYVFPSVFTLARRGIPSRQYLAKSTSMTVELLAEKLLNRGWVLQERLLSPRTVYFGEHLTWECSELLAWEAFPCGVPTRKKTHYSGIGYPTRISTLMYGNRSEDGIVFYEKVADHHERKRLYSRWFYLLYTYSWFHLTFQTDALPGLSGLAKKFKEALQDDYLAGMWRGRLLRSLLWGTSGQRPASNEYIAPTWSWASCIRVWFPLEGPSGAPPIADNGFSVIYTAEVKYAEVTLSTSDPTGKVSGGYIQLLGHKRQSHTRELHNKRAPKWADYYDDRSLYDKDATRMCGGTIHFAIGYEIADHIVVGLILEPTETDGQYRRVGYFQHPFERRRSLARIVFDEYPEFRGFDPDHCDREVVTII